MRELTKRQCETLRLRDIEGMSWCDIADLQGIARSTVRGNHRQAEQARERLRAATEADLETHEGVAIVRDSEVSLEDVQKAQVALAQVGFGKAAQVNVKRRMLVGRIAEEVTVAPGRDELLEQINLRIAQLLSFMDPLLMSGSSLKELSATFSALVDKAQLLQGLPTQIMGREERRKMDELVPQLLAEIERRGAIQAVKVEYSEADSQSA